MAETHSVDLVVVGSGTGLAAALAAAEQGLSVVVLEKTDLVGGSTAKSGGAFWIPGNRALERSGDTPARAERYVEDLAGNDSPRAVWSSCLRHGPATVEMLSRMTPLRFFWARGYCDYQPERVGGSALGRTVEARPFNANLLSEDRARLRGAVMEAPVPMPVTGADYKWLNLMAVRPAKAIPRLVWRLIQGIGGKLLGRNYVAGGQALAAGLFVGCRRAGVPIWTGTSLAELIVEDGRVVGVLARRDGELVEVKARLGVVLATGGFEHNTQLRSQVGNGLGQELSLGAPGNTGDGQLAAREIGAQWRLMDQSWWFPAVAPLPGQEPQVLLAERSLPGSLIVDDQGQRFINEASDYMRFGQQVVARSQAGSPGRLWLVFDQRYRNSYVFAGQVWPGQQLPKAWQKAGIAVSAETPEELAHGMSVPPEVFRDTLTRFNELAQAANDEDYRRGASAYDRYYGDPGVLPNPNLRPLQGRLYAVEVVLSDLGTCGGVLTDEYARVLTDENTPIEGLYAVGNASANVYGKTYPGAGATIGQGLVMGYVAARHAAGLL